MDNNETPERGVKDSKPQKSAGDALIEQRRRDALLELERMRKWIDDDEPPPVKMSCKLSQHIVAKPEGQD
jgi:hypothetical protein